MGICRRGPFAAILFAALPALGLAQIGPTFIRADQDLPAGKEWQRAVIDSVMVALNDTYVFPDVAEKMEKHVRKNFREGKYDAVATMVPFTMALTEDLREISRDLHLGVLFLPAGEIAAMKEPGEEEQQRLEAEARERLRRRNFMFEKLEILPGNVGYLKLNGFPDTKFSGSTAAAAMNFLANCDALIIDLRENGGGSPSLIQLMMGYLLREPTHLNSFYVRKDDTLKQFWSAPYAPGSTLADTPLYVLVGPRTGSAAEEFAYNVQSLKRGALIGQSTWGGAHPVERFAWRELNVAAQIPFGRAINPVTGTNWEGTGVQPDQVVESRDALAVAHLQALRAIREAENDPGFAAWLDWHVASIEADLHPVALEPSLLESYAGVYEDRVLTFEDGVLHYRRGDQPKRVLTPMSETFFKLEGLDEFRIEFVRDESGAPVMLRGHYGPGRTDESRRTGG